MEFNNPDHPEGLKIPLDAASENQQSETSTNLILPDKVLEYQQPDVQTDFEAKKYKISFDKYIEAECGINGLDGLHAQSAIRIIRDIGLNFNDGGGFASGENVCIEHVYRESEKAKNEYAVFYKNVEGDAEIKEIKIVDEKRVKNPITKIKEVKKINYRIFFYITPNDKTFHIRAITSVHKNIR